MSMQGEASGRLAKVNGARINYRLDGRQEAPVLVLSNSLGADLSMWEPQLAAFTRHFRVLRYDTRGHGGSEVTPGDYTLDLLGRDVVGLLDQLEIKRASFCGLSMGGLIGMWLGLRVPDRMQKLVLCNTGACIGSAETWDARIDAVRKGGVSAICDAVLGRWFTPSFREREPGAVDRFKQVFLKTTSEGYVANCAAIRDTDLRDAIAGIRAPTLVVTGAHDLATPPAGAKFMVERIPGAKYVELDAAHISNVEVAARFTEEILQFLIV
jgi:3-oxoadipate enol-lactonase